MEYGWSLEINKVLINNILILDGQCVVLADSKEALDFLEIVKFSIE